MRRILLNLFVAAIIVAVLGFFAAPGVAFFALRSAAGSNDVNGLQTLVDFDAVRRSLRPQLDARPEAQVPAPADGPAAAPAVAVPTQVERPLLWRIELAPPSYLFGTIHLPDERVTKLPPVV